MSDLRTFLLSRIWKDDLLARIWKDDAEARGSRRGALEVQAKRAIVDRHRQYAHTGFCECCFDDYPCADLRALGAIYDQHPDYREEWRP